MANNMLYRCVNCGEKATALYKSYGPSVLKLTKCDCCHGVVDKYVEYDPVIVMIDLVLMAKEAQRHLLYNTEFKTYWKLFIILSMLETYGVWHNDSLITIGINAMCDDANGSTGLDHNSTLNSLTSLLWPESWKSNCWAWRQSDRTDESDLFIWEKDFYIQFISTLSGIAAFIATTYCITRVMQYFGLVNKVGLERLLKAVSLGSSSLLFTLPMLVWGGAETAPAARLLHYALVFLYGFVVFCSVFTVVYECRMMALVPILLASNYAKFLTAFYVTPFVRESVS